MSSKGITWDATADRKLLLGVLKMQNVSIDYKAMAHYMSVDGQTCTESSIKNRMFKLKQMAKNDGPGDENDTPTPKTSSRKRGAAGSPAGETPTKKGKGANGKGPKAAATEGDKDSSAKQGIKQEDESEDELA